MTEYHENTYALQVQNLTIELEGLVTKYSPSYLLKPRLSIDGNQWCALYGEDLQCGVVGFGDSPELAYLDFDRAWKERLKGNEG